MLEDKAFLHGNNSLEINTHITFCSWQGQKCCFPGQISSAHLSYQVAGKPSPSALLPHSSRSLSWPSLKSSGQVQAVRVAEEDAVKDEQCQGGLPVSASLQKPIN